MANVIAHAASPTVAPAEMVRPGPTTIEQWVLRHDWESWAGARGVD
ncbi:MAG TPA: hypothetical protein VFZ72_22895 [Jiangellaceae bacterium]